MGLGHAQVCQQQGQRLGLHRTATIGMKGQLARFDLLLPAGFANQAFSKVGLLGFVWVSPQRSLLAVRATLPCEKGLPSGIWPDF
jgi:hypothetical protein